MFHACFESLLHVSITFIYDFKAFYCAEIKADLSAKSGWRTGASGDQQGVAPEITISGSSTKEAVLRGVGQLVQEIEAKEDALARASSRAEDVIRKGSEELDRRWNLLMALWKGLERKNKLWKVKREHCEHDVSKWEQQLATREAELTRKAEALDLRKLELEREVEQRLAEMEKNHQEVLKEKVKDIKFLQLRGRRPRRPSRMSGRNFSRSRSPPAPCGSKPSWTARRWPGWRSP